jgi:2-hydroxy-3-oxopropionate reductase
MRLGFIGLGAMGRPMALHLLRAGHQLAVWARRPEASQPLCAAGAVSCASAAAVARRAEVVFTNLTAGADVEQVTFAGDGLQDGLGAGSILVDLSTIAPEMARSLAQRLACGGVEMLDAPVSGGEQGAIAATLAIMVGGKAAVFERVRPLFEVLGKKIVHVGDSGAGQVAKACNQMVMVAAIQAVAEALHLSRAAGADPARVRQALAGGSAGSRVLEVMGGQDGRPRFCRRCSRRACITRTTRVVLAEALSSRACRCRLPPSVGQQLNALMARGWGHSDTASLLRVLESVASAACER